MRRILSLSCRRAVLPLLALAVMFGFLTAKRAEAQPAAPIRVDQPAPPSANAVTVPRSATPAGKGYDKRDIVESPKVKPVTAAGKRTKAGLAIAFWAFAALTVIGSIFVLTRKNLIVAVMGMVGTFFALAALYMLLYAHFLAIIQLLVYAGAIMVLFVFVIMILNKPEDEPYAHSGRVGKALAGLAMAYLVYRVGAVLIDVPSRLTPAQQAAPPLTAEGYAWGSTAAVGWNLFNEYAFAFEAVSILLLIAVVGSIAISRPFKQDDTDTPSEAAAGGH